MSDPTSRERYRNLRESFDELQIQDKALFLVEAAVSTVARGLEQAGETLAGEMEDLFSGGRARRHRERSPGAARPATSEKQAPHRRQKPGSGGQDDDTTGEAGEGHV